MHRISLVSLLAVVLFACGRQSSTPPATSGNTAGQPAQDTVIIPDTTKVADAAARSSLTAYNSGSGVMRFSRSSPVLTKLKSGDVLVSAPSDTAPDGYLRKVTAVHQDGTGIVLDTTQANLTDAISQGELNADFQLTGDDLLRTEGLPQGVTVTAIPASGLKPQAGVGENYGFTFNFDHTFVPLQGPNATGTIRVDGGVNFNVGYGVNVGIKGCFELPPICVKSFEAKVGFDQSSHLNITGDFQGAVGNAVSVGTQYFKPKVFFIGPVPVVLVPKVELFLTASGQITAHVKFTANESVTAQVGARWTKDKGWKDISGFGITGNLPPPTFSGTLKPRVGAQSVASFKLYDVAGPEATLEAGVGLDVAYPRNPNWIVTGFMKGTLGFQVKLPILGTLASYSTTVFDISKELGRSGNTPPTLTLTDLTRPPVDSRRALRELDLGVPISFLPGCDTPGLFFFIVQDAEDGCNVKVTMVSDRDGSLSLRPTFTTSGPRTLTVTVQDSQGATTSGSFKVDIVNAPPSILGGIGDTVPATVPLLFTLGASDPNSGRLGCDAISVTGGPVEVVSNQNGDCRYSVTFPTPGSQTLTVTARDPQGAASTRAFKILVTAPPAVLAPVWVNPGLEARGADGRLIPDEGHVHACEVITFSARATDPGGLPIKYVWFATIRPGPYKVLTPDADGKVRVSYSKELVYFDVYAVNSKGAKSSLEQVVIWDPCPTPIK